MGKNAAAAPTDLSLHARVIGTGPRQLVLLHGFAASRHTWDNLIPLIPLAAYTLHLLDLKGHGTSPQPAYSDYSLHEQARLVAAYLENQRLDEVTLIGHSMGGAVALLTALDCDCLARLVLIGCPGYLQTMPRFMAMLALPYVGPLFLTLAPARLVARKGLKAAFFRPERISAALIEGYANGYRTLTAARALAATVRQLVPADHAALVASYGRIAIPTLLLWGAHDRIVKRWQGEQLQRDLAAARLVVIPDCGHNPHEELPRETWLAMRPFLEGALLPIDKINPAC